MEEKLSANQVDDDAPLTGKSRTKATIISIIVLGLVVLSLFLWWRLGGRKADSAASPVTAEAEKPTSRCRQK